jgi:protein SCO1/2
MKHAAVRLSESYAIAEGQRAMLARADQVYGDAQLSPDELGGYFGFSDWRGREIAESNFVGRWTILYFGYARCQGSCRTAVPLMTQAAHELREKGHSARAVFVDIESPPMGLAQMVTKANEPHGHGNNWSKRLAMAELALGNVGKLEVLTGSRAQLARATAAFHVMREHVPPRPEESDISINHSSMIYLIGPDTLVAGYGYHDMTSETMVSLVEQLSKAKRNPIDLAAIRRRYIRGACGGDL